MWCIMSGRSNWHWLCLKFIANLSHYCPKLHFKLNADSPVCGKNFPFTLIKLDNAIHELFLDHRSSYFNGNQWKISRLPQEEIKVQTQSQKNSPWRFVKSGTHWRPVAFPGLVLEMLMSRWYYFMLLWNELSNPATSMQPNELSNPGTSALPNNQKFYNRVLWNDQNKS